jgi:hypothetical protein
MGVSLEKRYTYQVFGLLYNLRQCFTGKRIIVSFTGRYVEKVCRVLSLDDKYFRDRSTSYILKTEHIAIFVMPLSANIENGLLSRCERLCSVCGPVKLGNGDNAHY